MGEQEEIASEGGQMLLSCVDRKCNGKKRGGEVHMSHLAPLQATLKPTYSDSPASSQEWWSPESHLVSPYRSDRLLQMQTGI